MSSTTTESIERSGDAGGTGALEVPSDFRCAECGYPSGASGSVVCPECGRAATRLEVDAGARRLAYIEAWERSGVALAVRRWAVVIAVYSVGAAVVGQKPWALAVAPVVLAAALSLSVNAGWVVARLQCEELRAFTRVMWQRMLWRLHLPWLVAPAFVAIAVLVGLIDLWGGAESGGVYWLVVTAGLALWLIGCLVVFVGWWMGYVRLRSSGAPGYTHLGRSEAAAFVLGLVVVAGASGIGFLAGTVAAEGVADWLGIAWLMDLMDEF
ncbi:MAG: zinc ribbon domain-containing protein [Phycisphaerales bacterium JB054]